MTNRIDSIFGNGSQNKLYSSSVLIVGLQHGYGAELAKNLILDGIGYLYLYDNNLVNENDVQSGFFYNKTHIGQPRSKILFIELSKINRTSKIIPATSYFFKQNVTILFNQNVDFAIQINNYTRSINSYFINSYSGGFSYAVFVDAYNHVINNKYNDIFPIAIESISCNGIVKTARYSYHNFKTNDIVTFFNIDGLNVEQLYKNWNIEYIDNTTFKLKDYDINDELIFTNGYVKRVQIKELISNKTFEMQLINIDSDNDFIYYSKDIITAFINLYTNGLSNKLYNSRINSSFISASIKHNNIHLLPVASILCSQIHIEILKLITQSFIPANQWIIWSDEFLLSSCNTISNIKDDNLIKNLYGEQVFKNLSELNILIPGANGLTVEHIKNLTNYFYLSDVFKNNILIFDNDIVSSRHLEKNFILSKNDIGKYKCDCLKDKKIYGNLNYSINTINKNIDNLLLDEIKKDNLVILNGLDNIEGRQIIDNYSYDTNIPFFDIGINNLKLSIQPIIPYQTETYTYSRDFEHEQSYPECIIRHYPNTLEHAYHWSKEMFNIFSLDSDKSSDIFKLYDILQPHLNTNTKIDNDNFIIKEIINFILSLFIKNYYFKIKTLTETFDCHHRTSDNLLFWSNGKRFPQPIKFDYSDKYHIEFVRKSFKLLCFILDININEYSIDDIIKECEQLIDYNNLPNSTTKDKPDTEYIDMCILYKDKLKPLILDIKNTIHYEWIKISSLLRARNYRIPEESINNLNNLDLSLSSSCIASVSHGSGLIILELLKYIIFKTHNNQNIFKNYFINFENNFHIYSTPIKMPTFEINKISFNGWEKFIYKGNSSIRYFKNYYEKFFNITIGIITINSTIIYAEFLNSNLDLTFKELYPNANQLKISIFDNISEIDYPVILIVF